jgi:hypothetical protein
VPIVENQVIADDHKVVAGTACLDFQRPPSAHLRKRRLKHDLAAMPAPIWMGAGIDDIGFRRLSEPAQGFTMIPVR